MNLVMVGVSLPGAVASILVTALTIIQNAS